MRCMVSGPRLSARHVRSSGFMILATHHPPLLVAESGIHTRADVERLAACGARAILVGESLMRAGDLQAKTRELLAAH